MSEWIVYSKDGNTERCRLKALEYSGTWMGERAVTATFEYHSEVAFEVFDYLEYRGEVFELDAVPTVKKTSSFDYSYDLRFVSKKYELERCEMRDLVPNDNGVVYPTPLTFSFTGDVRYLVERIQACLDALYGEGVWSIVVADGVESEEKNITLAQQNCWNALALVNTTYGLNFYVKGREVVIGGTQPVVSHTFEYGKGNGLYEIERSADTDKGIVTKLRAYGGTRNLDYSYPKQPEWNDSALSVSFALSPLRLMLPSFKADGKTDFVLADDATIAKYGIREASMVYDDIYPTITGSTNSSGEAIDEIKSVDAVDDSASTFTVYLYDLGFDLEEHLTTSEAQLSMKSGTLQGYTFNISSIEKQSDGGYKLVLGRNSLEGSEESGFYVPNADWNMAAGDKFVLLNILMPQAYIREAEERLLARAKEYLAQYGKTNFSYNIGLHDKFLVEHGSVYGSLLEGSKLSVRDAEIGIDEDVTIQSITITENMEENILPQVKVTLNNEPSASTLDRIQGKLNDIANETAANSFSSQNELLAQYRKKLDKPFFDKLFVAIDADGNEIASNDVTTPVAYIKALYDVAVVGGVTMYVDDKSLDIPSIYAGLPIDTSTLRWIETTDSDGTVTRLLGINPDIDLGGGAATWDELEGKPSWIGNTKPSYNYSEILQTPDLSVYALASDLESLQTKIDDFLEGSDTDTIINKWLELESFLSGLAETDNLATILGSKADKATTLAGYGITDAYTKSAIDTLLGGYVTLATAQTITGEKNFTGGLKVNGSPIVYDATNKYWKLEGDLLVTGGVTMYGSDSEFTPSTIMDAIATDGTNLQVVDGVLTFVGETGGLTEVCWDDVIGRPTLLSSFIDDVGYLKKSGGQMTGNIGYTLDIDSYEVGLPAAGKIDFTDFLTMLSTHKSFMASGCNIEDGYWYNIISLRHRNGADDGGSYGMYLYSSMTNYEDGNLYWGRQINGSWHNRVILDSVNWSQYVTAADGGNYLPLSGGVINSTSGSYALTIKSNHHQVISLQSNQSETSINYANNVGDVWVLGANAGGLPNSFGLWYDPIAKLKFSVQKNGCTHIYHTGESIDNNNGSYTEGIRLYGKTKDNSWSEINFGCDPSMTYDSHPNQWTIARNGDAAYNNELTIRTYSYDKFVFFRTGDFLVAGGITMYSDIRKKTKLQDVELSLKQIADAPLIEHYYNSDEKRTTHVGSIAQYWAGLNDWFCKLDNEGFYTMEIQNAALASAISIARHLQKYETKTDRTIRKLKQRVSELEEKIEELEKKGA